MTYSAPLSSLRESFLLKLLAYFQINLMCQYYQYYDHEILPCDLYSSTLFSHCSLLLHYNDVFIVIGCLCCFQIGALMNIIFCLLVHSKSTPKGRLLCHIFTLLNGLQRSCKIYNPVCSI